MARKYIKNCTGDDCEVERRSTRFSSIASKGIFYFLLVGFVAVSVYVLFFAPYLQILNIEITGTQTLDNAQIKQRVSSMLEGKYLGIIPKNNYMFISQKRVQNVLTGQFKRIRKMTMIKKFPDSVTIEIDERRALLVWCAGENCYLIDENGTAYGEADFSTPELTQNNLLKITDTSSRSVSIGENILEQSYERYALEIKDALSKAGFEISGEYLTPSRMAGEIRVKTEKGFDLYFSTHFPLELAIETLLVIFNKEIPDEKKSELEYVDLRNENKVFYKFKNLNPENVEGNNEDKVE
ncbi:MAG: hypothetical protein ACD_8C00057G0018 [uncultured bacterium]|nr:MAG: hypothetical protein ACD_8C00057G0018 [uncultured bacterium]